MEVAPSEALLPFGRYVIRERLGRGGMGEVFLAVAVGADGFEKPVVVKRLLPQFAARADIASLLSAEARLMTRLVHPNIVQVIDFGRGDTGDYFLVMELVSGTDLGRLCQGFAARKRSFPAPLALFIMSQVLRGLAYAHETASAGGQKLVHRDISPGNVLLSTFGEVKVADFGVTLVASSAKAQANDDYVVGNPAYMAPEQIERRAVDERADLYGAGAVLFQMLTGSVHQRRPAGGTRSADLSDESAALLERVGPRPLVALVERALARRPEERFANAREMTRCIEQLVTSGEPISTADALADAVSEFVHQEPSGSKPVLVLSASPAEGLSSGTELRKVGDGPHGFTLRIHKGGNSVASSARSSLPPAANDSWRAWGVVIFGSIVFFGWFATRPPPGETPFSGMLTTEPSAASTESLHAVEPAPAAAANHDEPNAQGSPTARALALSGPSTAEPSEAPSQPPVSSEHKSDQRNRTLRAREANKSSPLAQQGTGECHGQLHLYAAHGWLLSGGPSIVQAPGRYNWPCGTYTLRASSRTNSESRSIGVTIRDSAPEIVDLR